MPNGEDPSNALTHTDARGTAQMVDVGNKAVTSREARAAARIAMKPETAQLIRNNEVAKGDVLTVARIAGIMGAKKTADLIPLCHELSLVHVAVDFEVDVNRGEVAIVVSARANGQTGVEMEALTAVTVAALTIYDMCKAVDREMEIGEIHLLYKAGGKSGIFRRA